MPSTSALLTSGPEGTCLSHLGFPQGFLAECALSKPFPGPSNQAALGLREPLRLRPLG